MIFISAIERWPICVLLVVWAGMAPVHGQTPNSNPKFTLQGPAEQTGKPFSRGPSGRPCLDLEAAARAHVVNPSVLDHVVSVKNSCPRTIKVRVCYFQSEHCNEFAVGGYKRVDTVLGIMTKVSIFRYSVTEIR